MAILTGLLLSKILGNIKDGIGFVVVHWKEFLIAGMIATIWYQNFSDREWFKWLGFRTIDGMKQEIQLTKEQLALCEQAKILLKEQIEEVNTQINEWSKLSGSLQQENNKLNQELIRLAEQSKQEIEDILNDPTPKTCKEAIQYLRDAAKGDLKWSE